MKKPRKHQKKRNPARRKMIATTGEAKTKEKTKPNQETKRVETSTGNPKAVLPTTPK